jgi:hypothetical protein
MTGKVRAALRTAAASAVTEGSRRRAVPARSGHVACTARGSYSRDESENTFQRVRVGDGMPTMTVSGHQYSLDSGNIETALHGALPEPIHEHFVVINGRRWPPKQVLALVTGLDRADFTTHHARRVLTRLGFPAGRTVTGRGHHAVASGATASPPSAGYGADERPEPPAETLRPYIGLWVAMRGDEVLVAAPTPKEVVAWLSRHGQRAQSMFRVVDSEQAITGAAPQ